MSDEDDELIQEFITESLENLETIEEDLLNLEKGGEATSDVINNIFRNIHSIKGASGFFGLEKIGHISHAAENLLMRLRDGEIPFALDMIDLLFPTLDKLNNLLDQNIDDDGIEIEELSQLMINYQPGADNATAAPSSTSEKIEIIEEKNPTETHQIHLTIAEAEEKLDYVKSTGQNMNILLCPFPQIKGHEKKYETIKSNAESLGEIIFEGEKDNVVPEEDSSYILVHISALEIDLISEAFSEDEVIPFEYHVPKEDIVTEEKTNEVAEEQVKEAKEDEKEKASSKKEKTPPKVATTANETIRVSVNLLDHLINLAGELVLGRNALLLRQGQNTDPEMAKVLQNIDHITNDLQEKIMRTRMQPVGTVLNKFQRIVRDLAKTLNKSIELTISGQDLELDRSILEQVADPLTHLIRNSVDHGIEAPADRLIAGKDEKGTIALNAFHKDGHMNIQIVDDGKGIDPEIMKKKCLEKGIITQDQADTMSDNEAARLIFAPGFSTAEQVSAVSGRGVGMDVVKTNIENLGGNVGLKSELGQGCIIDLRLPLTLAIIPSLIIVSNNQRFAIPQINIIELALVREKDFLTQVECINGSYEFRLRGDFLPLIFLNDLLNNDFDNEIIERKNIHKEPQKLNIIVLRTGNSFYGLVVDSQDEIEEIVVKPLSQYLKSSHIYAGSTIMGDGSISMILDTTGIAKYAGLSFETEAAKNKINDAEENKKSTKPYVLFKVGEKEEELFAVDVESIERIEEIQYSEISKIGNKEYYNYAEEVLPILRFDRILNITPPKDIKEVYLLLPKNINSKIGLMAMEVLDIIDVPIDEVIQEDSLEKIYGSIIMNEKVIFILEASDILGKSFFEEAS